MSGDADVIVGGGPAARSPRRGWRTTAHDVLLLDKASFPLEKPCAEYFSPGVIEVLDRLGALEQIHAAEAAWPLGIRIQSGRESFTVTYPDAEAGALDI